MAEIIFLLILVAMANAVVWLLKAADKDRDNAEEPLHYNSEKETN